MMNENKSWKVFMLMALLVIFELGQWVICVILGNKGIKTGMEICKRLFRIGGGNA